MSTTKAKLTGGKIVTYDCCHDKKKEFEQSTKGDLRLHYLGIGTIYEIDGKRQHFAEKLYFWNIVERLNTSKKQKGIFSK